MLAVTASSLILGDGLAWQAALGGTLTIAGVALIVRRGTAAAR